MCCSGSTFTLWKQIYWHHFHSTGITASPSNASLLWLFFRLRCSHGRGGSLMYVAGSLWIDNSWSNASKQHFFRARVSVSRLGMGWRDPLVTSSDSCGSGFGLSDGNFRRQNSKSTNFSATVVFLVWRLMTIIVPHSLLATSELFSSV